MKSTYINDNKTSVYPFKVNSTLPFSRGCIIGAGVCIQLKKASSTVDSVYVTGVEITSQGAALTISVSVSITEDNESYSSSIVMFIREKLDSPVITYTEENSDYKVLAWFVPGTIEKTDIGSYNVELEFDRSVLNIITSSYIGKYPSITVNSTTVEAPECVELVFSGILETSVSTPQVINININDVAEYNTISIGNISADTYWSTQDSALTVVDDYSQVKVITVHINGQTGSSVTPSRGVFTGLSSLSAMGFGSTLHIKIEKPVGAPEGLDSSDYIVCTLDNAIDVSDVIASTSRDPEDENARWDYTAEGEADVTSNAPGARLKKWICRNDSIGDAVVLTLHGTELFPNCFDSASDDAGGSLSYADGQ